ncbi:hemolysin activation/secretion protein [Scytonema hofmannii PCC 7110]|uniref:Hemolysin activation/secretion protein n=2 Tax=Scytonema hofmannii TaxID=34078 RepID=A0A139WSA4_9CYAN|nr:hemolysin activation/secretion protein [Scytonema hofmannii PCC 7110]
MLTLKISGILGVLITFHKDSALAQISPDRSQSTDSLHLTVNFKSKEQPVNKIDNVAVRGTNLPTNHPNPQPLPKPSLELPSRTLPSSSEGSDLPKNITVTKFEFEGNTAFSDEELTKFTDKFIKRSLTFAELLEVETAVTKLYTDAGYINSGAVIPAGQTLSKKGSVVKIRIIEGGVEKIEVTGTRRLNSNYVRRRLALLSSKPLNQKRLLEALQLLQLDPLIQNISAELSAGSRSELSLLTVKVIEADSFNTEFFIDNGRAPSVGSLRRGVRINQANLFGFGDALGLEYVNTNGSNAFDFSYTIPVNPRNGTIILGAGLTDTEVIEPPFDRIDIIGNSRYFELGFRQPLILSSTREFALGLSASRQESKSELLGVGFPLSAGANEEGETRISTLRFFQEYRQRSPQEAFVFRSQFSLGLNVFNATVNDDPPDTRFFSWRGQGQYVRLLAPQTLLVVRSDIQLTNRALVPLEQFGLGGLRSVRGYRQDVLLTDNGFYGSAEVQLPVLRVKSVEGVLQVVPFVDFGIGWNSSGNSDPDPNTLLGLGLGLQWQMGDRLTARLDYGIPLTDIEDRGRTLQEDGLYFSVIANPF